MFERSYKHDGLMDLSMYTIDGLEWYWFCTYNGPLFIVGAWKCSSKLSNHCCMGYIFLPD